jgi:hypothetical protein
MLTNNHRRSFICNASRGLSMAALATLINGNSLASSHKPPAPKAKRIVQISLVGGLSHLDSFDYKPELSKFHGKKLNADKAPDVFFGQIGLIRKNDWDFKPRGKSGLHISEMFPNIAKCADDLTIIRSMVSDSANHTPALFIENSGFSSNGFPSMGSWISYGLGSENSNLPVYIVLPDGRGEPNGCASNWSNGFLPANHQGTIFQSGDQPLKNLKPSRPRSPTEEKTTLEFLNTMNSEHLARFPGDTQLAARIKSHEMAARMQLSVPEATSINSEPSHILKFYGMDNPETADCARRCILARRLLERGVRFVQIYSGGPIAGNPRASWDAHENVKENHSKEALKIDQPVAALVMDLKQRGMLDDTLVLFTTEFGRTPFAQSASGTIGTGRDHNKYAFSIWMAGAGLKNGISFGESDPIGWKVANNPVEWHDFHATVLHLLGIDHEQLTFYHNGIQRRLTNVHGNIIKQILL